MLSGRVIHLFVVNIKFYQHYVAKNELKIVIYHILIFIAIKKQRAGQQYSYFILPGGNIDKICETGMYRKDILTANYSQTSIDKL